MCNRNQKLTHANVYLIAGSDIFFGAINMHTISNILTLLFKADHNTTSLVVKSLKVKNFCVKINEFIYENKYDIIVVTFVH